VSYNISYSTRTAKPCFTTSNTVKDSSTEIDQNHPSDFEDEEDDVNGVIHIGHDIVINGPLDAIESLNGLKASKLAPEERNRQMSIVNIPKDFKFASDVFNLSVEIAEKIGCEKGIKQGNYCLELQKDNESQIRFKVPIACVRNSQFERKLNDYLAWINDVTGWRLIPASYKVSKMTSECLLLYNMIPTCSATMLNSRNEKTRSLVRKV